MKRHARVNCGRYRAPEVHSDTGSLDDNVIEESAGAFDQLQTPSSARDK